MEVEKISKIDGYRKGWATRYLREAKAELIAAKNTPYLAVGFIMEALTKAQAAIYYSLGDPAFIIPIVHESLNKNKKIKDPVLNFLVEIEKTLQKMAQNPSLEDDQTIAHVEDIIDFTSEIVGLYVGISD